MKIVKVIVEKEGTRYNCMEGYSGIFKCGKCLYGIILIGVADYKCKVCGARLKEVLWE